MDQDTDTDDELPQKAQKPVKKISAKKENFYIRLFIMYLTEMGGRGVVSRLLNISNMVGRGIRKYQFFYYDK